MTPQAIYFTRPSDDRGQPPILGLQARNSLILLLDYIPQPLLESFVQVHGGLYGSIQTAGASIPLRNVSEGKACWGVVSPSL